LVAAKEKINRMIMIVFHLIKQVVDVIKKAQMELSTCACKLTFIKKLSL